MSSLAQIRRRLGFLAPSNIGAVYTWIVLIIIFALISPENFFNVGTARLILSQYAVTGLIAFALLLPLTAGLYDLSVGSAAGLAGISSAWVLANVSPDPSLAVAAGLGVALLIGAANCLVVLVLGVDSFIGTLATGSVFLALTVAISGGQIIGKNVNGPFQHYVALVKIGGVDLPVFYMLGALLILAYLLERTAFGRRSYAIGFDLEVARLGGVRVIFIRSVGLLVSASLAGLAGITATARVGAGSPDIGPSYLLPAFAAVFLGATQFRGGRFNPWGTIVAVLLLGTGNVGLLVVGAPVWSPQVFTGVLLIAAVALTSAKGITFRRPAWLNRRPRSGPPAQQTGLTSSADQAEAAAEQPGQLR